MTLILNQADWNELYQQTAKPQPANLVFDDFETVRGVPQCLVGAIAAVWN
jgi:hypothetical protein